VRFEERGRIGPQRGSNMTSGLAAKLTIHDPEVLGVDASQAEAVLAQRTLATPGPPPLRVVEGGERFATPRRRPDGLRRLLLCGADVCAAAAATLLVLTVFGDDRLKLVTLAATPMIVLVLKVAGLYDREQLRLVRSTLDEAPALLQVAGLYTLTIAILQPHVVAGHLWGGQIAALWLTSFVAILAARVASRWLAGRASSMERCLVIGDGALARRIREKLSSSRARAVVAATLPLEADEIDRLEGPDGVRRLVDELRIDRIIIAPATSEPAAVTELIRLAKSAGVQVSLLPRMLEVVGSAVEVEDIDGMMMMGVRPFGLSRSSRLLKRAFDLVTTSIGLIVVGPVLAVVAAAVRLDSNGPVFFRQVRVGRDGETFRIFKFRSMVVNAEEQKEQLRALSEVGEGMFKISRDPRVTRVGAFLRRTSLDELPQLFNVLRGEMSLVGPRPLVTDEDALVRGLDRSRLHLTPGMTGPWQVLGSRVPMQEMVGLDYVYVANWTLWLDLKLLIHTARHVLRGGNV
jgi:exopolysaccharide biosynthesis polyprenyl glycosylphosphotransferase